MDIRKSRRIQGLSPRVLFTTPTTSTAAALAISEKERTQKNQEMASNNNPGDFEENVTTTAQQSLEQVTNDFNRRFEEMQTVMFQQMSAIQSLVETNNAQMQSSVTSLRDELRNVESNLLSQNNPNGQVNAVVSSSIPTTIPTTTSTLLPPTNTSSQFLLTTESSTSINVPFSFRAAPSISTFASSQPIVHSAPFLAPPMASNSLHTINSQTISHRQKKIYPLPKFSGLPEEWQSFYETFTTSTQEFEYSDLHNILRLRESLEGNARESVESLLSSSRNVNSIMETLSQMFGRPEQLIKSQIQKVRDLSSVKESDLSSLISFANKVGNMTTFLESVGGSYHLANPLLLSELLSKLPLSRRLQWADKCLILGRMPTILDFSQWLSDLRKVANMVTDALPLCHEQSEKSYACSAVQNRRCRMCDKDCRSLAVCKSFVELPIEVRWQKVKSFKVCFSCLKFGHQSGKCFIKKKCEINGCNCFHHNLLHRDSWPTNSSSTNNIPNPSLSQARSCLIEVSSQSVLFQVIPVRIYGPNKSAKIFAFIDDGANVSIIDRDVARDLGISGCQDTLELQWINQQISREQTEVVDITLSGLENIENRFNMKKVYVPSSLDLPNQSFDTSLFDCEALNNISLESYYQIKPKMIISLAHAFLTVPIETPKLLTPAGPIATKTRLGWLVYGNVSKGKSPLVSCHFRKSNECSEPDELEILMKSYFGIETFGVRYCQPLISEDDQRALQILNATTKRVNDRFESGLLWRKDFECFPKSYGMALRRLQIVEDKMSRDPNFAKEYCNQIEEYVEKGYARILSDEEAHKKSNKTFYLPHFAVKNPNKTKIRFVFDAAAEINNMSLNKALLAGPDLNQPLQKVLFKFRQAPIAVCGDLKEMFHQVSIIPEDQDALRFLWRNGNISQPPRTYVMQRMIFGAACSPTTAQFVKNRNAEKFINEYPRAVAGIIEKHYVDDYVDCFDTEEEAIEVVKAIRLIHEAGGFKMHNLLTNSKAVAESLGISSEDKMNVITDDIERILGMYWVSNLDVFVFILKFHKVPKEILELKTIPTKRQLLSVAMSVFDPFGFVADYMVVIKILMQEVWKSGIEWDEKLPNEIHKKWSLWLNELPKITQFKVPRFYFVGCDILKIELHIFCDASEEALAAVGYWRIVNYSSSKIAFICGKTSCAPMRFHSIPKLELQAAVIAARLKDTIVQCHDRVKIDKTVFWSDSHTVIRWIRSDHRKYKQYVANRVSEILENSKISDWRWCPTLQNPADVATRAKYPVNYNPEGPWKNGPEFLLCGEEGWPDESDMGKSEDKSGEFKKSKHLVMLSQNLNTHFVDKIVSRSSKFIKTLRVFAWMARFCKNLRLQTQGEHKIEGELTVDEILNAELKIVKEVQRKSFAREYERLISRKNIDLSSNLKTLNPYVDESGILRVGGRLDNATALSENARRPAILPNDHKFSRLLVEFYHAKNCHQNTGNVIGDIREKYWIPSIRKLVRTVESQCFACKIRKVMPLQPQMGLLPPDRVTPYVRPFTYTGVDLFGPFVVNIRRRHEKRWVVIFTCMTVRAIHLEVVSDMSTDGFLLSLRNFVNRRGVPVQIRSDNGRNFVGINKELRNEINFMNCNEIIRNSSPLGIKWVFNTPSDPSAGGVWERLIQSVKKSLAVLLRDVTLKLDSFTSFLIECENIVNSRPLTHIPVTPYEPEPLTPNHFLLGCINSNQTPNNYDSSLNCLRKQWRVLQNLKNGFWGRWIREYLPDLTRRVKWCLPTTPMEVGNLVLICDEQAPRAKWRRGRVVGVYSGKDKMPRAADVRTCDGILKRPVSKLAILDVSNL